MSDSAERSGAQAYWRANISLVLKLLAVWAFVSYGLGIFLAGWLDQFHLGGYPLGFFFAQQGSILVFILLIFIYAWRMNRLDQQFDVDE